MSESIEAITSQALRLALDAGALRQQAYAANIANAGSAGFVPAQVDFESQLGAARRSLGDTGRIQSGQLRGVTPRLEPLRESSAGFAVDGLTPTKRIDLDNEAVKLAQNALHFQVLLRGLNRHLGILATAAGDGRK